MRSNRLAISVLLVTSSALSASDDLKSSQTETKPIAPTAVSSSPPVFAAPTYTTAAEKPVPWAPPVFTVPAYTTPAQKPNLWIPPSFTPPTYHSNCQPAVPYTAPAFTPISYHSVLQTAFQYTPPVYTFPSYVFTTQPPAQYTPSKTLAGASLNSQSSYFYSGSSPQPSSAIDLYAPHQTAQTIWPSPLGSTTITDPVESFANNLVINTKDELIKDGIQDTVISAGGQLAAHSTINPTSIGKITGTFDDQLDNLMLVNDVIYTPWKNAYDDTYSHPDRSLTEDMARYETDLSFASANSALSLAIPGAGGTATGILGGAASDTYRLQLQNTVLYNPATDFLGTQIYDYFYKIGSKP